MTAYGYARVSTRGQERDGNGMDAQVAQLQEAGCEVIVREVCAELGVGRTRRYQLRKVA